MKQNIKNNNNKIINSRLYSANYYDFMLFKGKSKNYSKSYLDNISIVDFSSFNIKDGILYSDTTWDKAINNGVELNNIGFTGMDNGFISFRKDRITNEKFLDLFLNSKFEIESDNKSFFMTPITGNTLVYEYPMYLTEEENEKYLSLKGGFYQGFFKLFGHDYQVLPDKLENDIILHFELKPRNDYEIVENTINYTHPNNKGIFFYIGTRAENKFWPYYSIDTIKIENYKKVNAQTEGYFSGCNDSGSTYNIEKNNVIFLENQWVKEEEKVIDNSKNYFAIGDDYFYFNELLSNTILCVNKEKFISDYKSCCDDYFIDNYFDNKCPEYDNNKFVEDKFIGEGVEITNDFSFTDSEGRKNNEHGFIEIETDNKFIIFDRTPSGFTVDNWEEGTKVVLTKKKNFPNANYFLLMNRTKTGYTAHNIDSYNEKNAYEYNLLKDIRNNVFALKINDDGSIGYRYGIFDCNSDNYYSIVEEYSQKNIIKYNEWNKINVRFTLINNNKMRIMFYVNGFLIFISKELDIFNFKSLDDVPEKQETVPYNISLGGGSLGLMETIVPNYYSISEYILPIERDFCGSFIGDIKSFKMYEGFIDYSTIINYLS